MHEKSNKNYFYKKMPDENFFVDIFEKNHYSVGTDLRTHWHEHIQFFYFTEGKALLRCGSKKIEAFANDIVIINSTELHSIENSCVNLKYYVIRIDLSFLFSNQIDSCQIKFMTPLANNVILFENLIRNDTEFLKYINEIIKEYFSKEIGFELSIKGCTFKLIALLLRNYIARIYTPKELNSKIIKLKQFSEALNYIENSYTKQITLDELATLSHISTYHFCRLFKESTGQTVIEYINNLRIKKAKVLLKESNLNMTEIALSCGFNDANYFSRIFKKNTNMTPSEIRKYGLTAKPRIL
ncbi:AraC family transcriptional regulator [Clostridium sp. DMHC 10]|nr:AraC family transcriptional regulator [Clostridium sp. DMHC 10]